MPGCTQVFHGLAKDCDSSMGGILELLIINHDYIDGKPTVTDGKITAIATKEIAPAEQGDDPTYEKFKSYPCKQGTSSAETTLNADENSGNNYKTTVISVQWNRMTTEKRIEVGALSVGEMAVIAKDANGKYWYYGYDAPVVATGGTSGTGASRGDANRYGIELTDNANDYPYEVDASIIDNLREA